MDRRVSTAPSPTGNKWVPNNAGGSCLLRQPSSKHATEPRSDVLEAVARPHTYSPPSLTPQFHWNLNSAALKTLSRTQVEQLYGLFKLYDSSIIGDALPSINCVRLVDMLRDAQLLDDCEHYPRSPMPIERTLSVEAVNKIFAQAAMGKMRMYLDADDQPALTFPLFCGVLMNCAMLLTLSTRPIAALRLLLPVLLEGSIAERHEPFSASKGLLGHFPSGSTTSLWTLGKSHALPMENTNQDFRKLPPFRQVIADCTRDKVHDELRQNQLERRHHVPDHLIKSFQPDTISLISTKFRTFDVFDHGMLPRNEVFPLLSSLGTRTDLPDPYAVVERMCTGTPKTPLFSSSETKNAVDSCVTLAELLQIIETTREAKRQSVIAQLAPTKSPVHPPAPAPKRSDVPKTELTNIETSTGDANSKKIAVISSGRSKSASTEGASGAKDQRQRRGMIRSKSRRSILSADANMAIGTPSQVLASNKRQGSTSKVNLCHHVSVSYKKKPAVTRRSSSMFHDILDTAIPDSNNIGDHGSMVLTHRSASTACNNAEKYIAADPSSEESPNNNSDSSYDTRHPSPAITVQVHGSSRINSSKILRIFMLLGGEHDGAISWTISLTFTTKEIMESDGIYYTTAPLETTRTRAVLPTQHTLTNALLMLKKRILAKLQNGFEQLPPNQLKIVDEILQDLQKRQPHFSGPTSRTSRIRASSAVNSSSAHRAVILSRFFPSASPMSSRRLGQMLPAPHSKSLHHYQFDLPNADLLATWEVYQGEGVGWIHDVNTASPVNPVLSTSKSLRSGHLSPLHLPLK